MDYSSLNVNSRQYLLEEKDIEIYKLKTVLKDLLAIITELETDFEGVVDSNGKIVPFSSLRALQINRNLAKIFLKKRSDSV